MPRRIPNPPKLRKLIARHRRLSKSAAALTVQDRIKALDLKIRAQEKALLKKYGTVLNSTGSSQELIRNYLAKGATPKEIAAGLAVVSKSLRVIAGLHRVQRQYDAAKRRHPELLIPELEPKQ